MVKLIGYLVMPYKDYKKLTIAAESYLDGTKAGKKQIKDSLEIKVAAQGDEQEKFKLGWQTKKDVDVSVCDYI